MHRAKTEFYRMPALFVGCIAAAVLCRAVSFVTDIPLVDKIFAFNRDCIYIGLFFVWGITVNRRIMQVQARRLLNIVAGLCVFWMIVREFKFRFVLDADVIRFLWYVYYIPLLLTPLLALLISVSLDRAENYRLPKRLYALFIPTAALILLVLTNDLHQMAFRFPKTAAVWSESDYTYGWLYYAVTGWIYLLAVLSFIVMLTRLRSSKGKRRLWLPLLPFGIALVYGSLYAFRPDAISPFIGDLSVVFCLVFMGYFECCIQCGLIHSNAGYTDAFLASTGISAQICDADYRVVYRASSAEDISVSEMKRAESAPLITDDKKILHNLPVSGGHAVWTEDVSALLEMREMLEFRGEELREKNALLTMEYEKEAQHKKVEEQNRLYDLLQSKTQTQLNKVDLLVKAYQSAADDAEKRRILAQIVILGSYIKRRKNFVLTVDEGAVIPEAMLSSALSESMRSLGLLGIRGSFLVDCGAENQSGSLLMTAYDVFECVMEEALASSHYLNVRVCRVNGVLRESILLDSKADFSAVKREYPAVVICTEEDGTQLVYSLEGRDAP